MLRNTATRTTGPAADRLDRLLSRLAADPDDRVSRWAGRLLKGEQASSGEANARHCESGKLSPIGDSLAEAKRPQTATR
jgi:hypothetical protein